MSGKTWFERALFLSWYCSIGDCSYCFMSTQKGKADPKKARRKKDAVIAEALLSRICRWKVEFISGGMDCYTIEEIADLARQVRTVMDQKQWLNVGPITQEQMRAFGNDIIGVCGAVECINPEIRESVCPSKPLEPVERMLTDAKGMGLKTAITIIIGLGESEKDVPLLIDFVKRHKLDRVTFYALNPHEGTPFKEGPKTDYYVNWIKETRNAFPDMEIIAGSWLDRLDELHLLLQAGADAFTKFPSLKYFGSEYANKIEHEVQKAGLTLQGTLTQVPSEDQIIDAARHVDADRRERVIAYARELIERSS